MNEQAKRDLLESIARIAPGRGVAEHESNDEKTFMKNFLPMPDHRRILEPDILLILGGRGAGKTQLFRLLDFPNGREAFYRYTGSRAFTSFQDTIWITGFKMKSKIFPTPDVVESSLKDADRILWRSFWIGLTLGVLLQKENDLFKHQWATEIPNDIAQILTSQLPRISTWLPLVHKHLELLNIVLDQLDDTLIQHDKWLFITYDELDRLVPSYAELAAPIRELLSFWLERWQRWERIRPKIFLRVDLFREEFLGFPDASKLRAHQIRLEWTAPWLYQLLIKRLANTDSMMLDYLQKIPLLITDDDPLLGKIPSREESLYQNLIKMMIGEYMGAHPSKGYTYRWVPNHLQDADGRIAPRSFLKLFSLAGEGRLRREVSLPGNQLLQPSDLQGALMETSEDRIRELTQEEYPWIEGLKPSFRGLEVPSPKETILQAIASTEWSIEPPGKHPQEILEYLEQLGIVEIRSDGRINVPEIYLYGFQLKRRGGIKRPK